MASGEENQIQEIEDYLDANPSATAEDVYFHTLPYSPHQIASAAAIRGGGGGGAQIELLGPYPITYQTANLVNPMDDGYLFGPSLTAGQVVLAAWIHTTTTWTAETSLDEFTIGFSGGLGGMVDIAGVSLNAQVLQAYNSSNIPAPATVIRTGTAQLCAALYTTGNATGGAGDMFALVLTV